MSTNNFRTTGASADFLLDLGAREEEAIPHETHPSENGINYARDLASLPMLTVSGTVTFGPDSPNAANLNTATGLRAFWIARGMSDTFLYRAQHAEFREVYLGSLGTGDASATVFAFSDGTDLHKYIDAATLQVYVDGTLKVLTTDYTLSGNNTDLNVTFGAAPGNLLPLTVSYEYYRSVRFGGSLGLVFPAGTGAAHTLNAPGVKRVGVRLVEDKAGGAYA